MTVDVDDRKAAEQLVSEEMTQYFATVDGQTGTYVLGDQRAYSVRAPHVDRNRIFGVHLAADTADEGIERLLEPFRRAVVPVTWYVDGCSAPQDLAARLAAHGLELRYSLTGMVKELTDGTQGRTRHGPGNLRHGGAFCWRAAGMDEGGASGIRPVRVPRHGGRAHRNGRDLRALAPADGAAQRDAGGRRPAVHRRRRRRPAQPRLR